jgi:hypothetical protein
LPLFARCAGAYAGRTIPVQIPDDVSITSPGSRKDNYNGTEEICQIRRSCRNIGRGPTCGMLSSSPRVTATDNDDDDRNESRIQRGLEIAPVPLNLEGKNRALVGQGSYIVNAHVPCNECHGAGPALTQFLPGSNPYFGQTAVINPATYFGGGRDFGPVAPGSAHIISRNLTPDKTGLPVGGHTFSEFVQIMRTGVDLDNLHPACSPGVVNSSCIPAPFRADLLQVMPWPGLKNLTDHDLRAVYEYLSAIPCVAGPPAPSHLHNDCF